MHRTALALLAALLAAGAAAGPAAAADPFTSAEVLGASDEGVLRFPEALAVRGDVVYVGDHLGGVIRTFSRAGKPGPVIGLAGSEPGRLGSVGGLAVDDDGTLYAVSSTNRIEVYGKDGAHKRTIASKAFNVGSLGRYASQTAGGGIAIAGDDLWFADTQADRLLRLSKTGRVEAVVGDRKAARRARLKRPQGLAVRGKLLAVADDQHHRVALYTTSGRFVRSIGAKQLRYPYDVVFDRDGSTVVVADNNNHRLLRFSVGTGKLVGSFGGTGKLAVTFPRALAVDGRGDVLVADAANDRIQVFTRGGKRVRVYGESGRSNGRFIRPMGLAQLRDGALLVSDNGNNRLQRLTPDGGFLGVWGRPSHTLEQHNELGVHFSPVAVTADADGGAWVGDFGRIQHLAPSGKPVGQVFPDFRKRFEPFLAPAGLAMAPDGRVLVADARGQLQAVAADGSAATTVFGERSEVTPDGKPVSSLGGVALLGGGGGVAVTDAGLGALELRALDGTLVKRVTDGLVRPQGVAVSPGGEVVAVADAGAHRIALYGADGTLLGRFGQLGRGTGQFDAPAAVAFDCTGALLVADTMNHRLQRFRLTAVAPRACAVRPKALPKPPSAPEISLKGSVVTLPRVLAGTARIGAVASAPSTYEVTSEVSVFRNGKLVRVDLPTIRTTTPGTKLLRTLDTSKVRALVRSAQRSRSMATLAVTVKADRQGLEGTRVHVYRLVQPGR